MLLSVCLTAQADDIGELEGKRKELQENMDSSQRVLNNTRAQKNELQTEIEGIDQELNELTDDLEDIREELDRTRTLLTRTEDELIQAEDSLGSQQEAFRQRARFMYMNGKAGYLNIICRASDLADLLNRVEYVNRIVAYDRDIIKNLEAGEALVAQKLEETKEHKLETQVLSLRQNRKLLSLQEVLDQKQVVMVSLLTDEERLRQQILSWIDEDKEIEKLIREKQAEEARKRAANTGFVNQSAPYTGGKLGFPLQSYTRMSSPYGNRTSPFGNRTEFHTGMDYAAPSGTNILAAEDGYVISAGVRGGYGNTVIIDHGNGLSTLYAHASKLLCSPGDVVNKGEVVAKVGSTGYSTGPHLHFEVRVNGAHTDPINYLRG